MAHPISHHHHKKRAKLVIYPGETTEPLTIYDEHGNPIGSRTITIGSIYVLNGRDEAYDMVGGPAPGHGYKDRGGHTAEPTPAGHYVLGHVDCVGEIVALVYQPEEVRMYVKRK